MRQGENLQAKNSDEFLGAKNNLVELKGSECCMNGMCVCVCVCVEGMCGGEEGVTNYSYFLN